MNVLFEFISNIHVSVMELIGMQIIYAEHMLADKDFQKV